MSQRILQIHQGPAVARKLTELTFAIEKRDIEQSILSLAEIRASQLNA